MKSFVALAFGHLVTSASASAVVTVPLTRIQRTGSYLKGSPDADRARALLLKSLAIGGPAAIPATNLAYVQYTTSVGIGSPPTYYNLVVDTATSNTFCGAGIPYVRTPTSVPTGNSVSVVYEIGYFSDLDRVTLARDLVITNQSIGDALSYADFEEVDGVIGFGPVNLTLGTLSPDTNATIPTVMNNLVSQNLIKNQVLGVYFAPSTNYSDTNGALTYGGIDSSLYEGELTYVPVTATKPSTNFWGINVTSATYGTYTVIPTSTAGIVDTGTTQVLLADDFFAVYLNAIPGAKLDSSTGLIEIPPSSIPYMQPLNFEIAGCVVIMDVAAQLIPTDRNIAWDGTADKRYGVVGKLGANSGGGLDFIFGQKFMERYYVVFDADGQRVGFAQTNNTFSVYHG